MKINSSVNETVYTPVKNSRTAVARVGRDADQGGGPAYDPQIAQSIASRLSVEKSLGEALSIAQASQSLLQKAMIISSQLRSMATQAAVTGRVNASELGMALSDINSSLSSYNGGVVGPVSTPLSQGSDLPSLPGIENEIATVGSLARTMQGGQSVSAATFDGLMDSLAGKSADYEAFITAASQKLANLGESYSLQAGAPVKNLEPLSNLLVNNPSLALSAQGNVSPQDVFRLLNS
jgi:hypothetical protein